jgi:S1-C subfamily serine protease
MKLGKEYRVKTPDGQTLTVREADVKQIIKGTSVSGDRITGVGANTTAGGPNASGSPATPSGKPPVVPPSGKATTGGSSSFANIKARADAVESPIIAVTIWEKFIDAKPPHGDLERAKEELAKWQKLQKENAEKINGKWIGGDERKQLLKRVDDLIEEGSKALEGNQTVQGMKKFEEALKLYPNSFEANFLMGYYYLTKGVVGATGRGNVQYQDKAIKSLEQAAKIMPTSAATWSNLAIGYNFRNRYVDSVQAAYRAAKIKDDKEIVQNLVNSIAHAPPGMQRNNPKLQPILEDAFILANKHGIDRKGGNWRYIPPQADEVSAEGDPDDPKSKGPPGVIGNGSGFVISEDGYILTNRHVVDSGKGHFYRVRFDDGTEKNAEVIAINDKADCALLKIKTESPLPFLRIADNNPNPAAKALVLGYPATGQEDMVMQVSSGDVASINPGDEHEVWFHLSTTHGNSGGPIVDKNLRVVGILTGGRQVHNVTYVLGVGPMQIRKFFESLGDKAPKVDYAPPGTGEFDGEKLASDARKSTLLVLVVRGDAGENRGSPDAAAAPEEPAPPSEKPSP